MKRIRAEMEINREEREVKMGLKQRVYFQREKAVCFRDRIEENRREGFLRNSNERIEDDSSFTSSPSCAARRTWRAAG